jgi:hypothetical protein
MNCNISINFIICTFIFIDGGTAQLGPSPPHCRDFANTHPVGLFCKSGLLLAEVATYTAHNEHMGRTSVPSEGFESTVPVIQAAADIRLRPHGHRDRREPYWASANNGTRVRNGEIQKAVVQGQPKTNKAWATDICTECVSVVCIESDQNTCAMCWTHVALSFCYVQILRRNSVPNITRGNT